MMRVSKNNNNEEIVTLEALHQQMTDNNHTLQTLIQQANLVRSLRYIKTLPQEVEHATREMQEKAAEIKAIARQLSDSRRQLRLVEEKLNSRLRAVRLASLQQQHDQVQSHLNEMSPVMSNDSSHINSLEKRRLSLTYVCEGSDGAQQERALAERKKVSGDLLKASRSYAIKKSERQQLQDQLQTLAKQIKTARKNSSGDIQLQSLPELEKAKQEHAGLLTVCTQCQQSLDELYEVRKGIKQHRNQLIFTLQNAKLVLSKNRIAVTPEMESEDFAAEVNEKLAAAKLQRNQLQAAINAEIELQSSSDVSSLDYDRAMDDFKRQLAQEPIDATEIVHDLYSTGRLLLTAIENMQTNDLNYRAELLHTAGLVIADYTNPAHHEKMAALAMKNNDGQLRKEWLAGGIFTIFFGVTMMAASFAVIGLTLGGALPFMIPAVAGSAFVVAAGAAMCNKSKRTGTAKALADFQHDSKLVLKPHRRFTLFNRDDERRPLLDNDARELKSVMMAVR